MNRTGVDWSQPPVYESEPAYIRRLHLELPGELERMDPTELEDAIEERHVSSWWRTERKLWTAQLGCN